MNTRKAMLALLCCAAILCSQSACQMAQKGASSGPNTLIGVYVSTDYLYSLEFQRYLEEHPQAQTEIGAPGHGRRYYATLTQKTLTGYKGETKVVDEYVFEGISGIPCFYYRFSDADAEYPSIVVGGTVDSAASEVHAGHFAEGEAMPAMDITIGILPEYQGFLYLNPVYQTADRRIFLVMKSAPNLWIEAGSPVGAGMGETLESSYTRILDGETINERGSVTVMFSVTIALERIALLSFDADYRLIDRKEFSPNDMPETFAPASGTACLIVESTGTDPSGTQSISYKCYDASADRMDTFFAREDGFCSRHMTWLLWAGQ